MGFRNFFNEEKEDPKVTELTKELASINLRIETSKSVLEKDLNSVALKKDEIMIRFAKNYYENFCAGTLLDAGFINESMNKLKTLDEEITELKEKAKASIDKYNEEKLVLERELEYLRIDTNVSLQDSGVVSQGCICQKCGTLNEADSRFCYQCGSSLTDN